MPNTILNPGKYIVIWADNDPEQGSFHANFKLKRDGEFIGLFDSKANHYAPIDEINYPAQETDKSYARMPNGTGSFMITDNPTPFKNNEETVSVERENLLSEIVVFPNPFSDVVQIESTANELFDLTCFDVNGRKLLSQNGTRSVQVGHLPKGIYILEIRKKEKILTRRKLVKMH